MTTPRPSSLPAATLAFPLAVASAAGAPEGQRRIQLLPMGTHKTRNGSPPQIIVEDTAHAQAIAAATLARLGPTEMFFDYDHQAVSALATNGTAKASGWAKRVFGDERGVWADVEFTAAAAAAIDAREYRYVSPLFQHARADGRVLLIVNAGLTNTPNLDLDVDLMAAASALLPTTTEGLSMDFAKILEALGLAPDTGEDAVLKAIADLMAGTGAMTTVPVTAMATALGLPATARPDELISAASALKAAGGKPDPAKFVPVEQLTAVSGRLKSLENDKVELAVASAIKSGKVAPASKDWALAYASENPAGFETFLKGAPTLLVEGSTVTTAPPQGSIDTMSATDRAVATAMNLTDEQFLAAKKDA